MKLVPLHKKYIEFVRRVRNHPATNRHLFSSIKITRKQQEEWFRRVRRDPTRRIWVLFDGKPVGYGQLVRIDSVKKTCELGLCVAPGLRGCGYGKAGLEALVRCGFRELGMREIELGVFADNLRAIALYRKAGFRKSKLVKNGVMKDSKPRDMLVMHLVRPRRRSRVEDGSGG